MKLAIFLLVLLTVLPTKGSTGSYHDVELNRRIAHSMLDAYARYIISARALKENGHVHLIEKVVSINEASIFFKIDDEEKDLLSMVMENKDERVKAVYKRLNADGIITVQEYQKELHPLF